MELKKIRKLVAFTLTSLAVVIQAVVTAVNTGGWIALADPTFIGLVSTLVVGGFAIWGTPNDLDEVIELVEGKDTLMFEEEKKVAG